MVKSDWLVAGEARLQFALDQFKGASSLQAAYSHNGLARKFDGEHDGAFRPLL
jgi:hypothetical protein